MNFLRNSASLQFSQAYLIGNYGISNEKTTNSLLQQKILQTFEKQILEINYQSKIRQINYQQIKLKEKKICFLEMEQDIIQNKAIQQTRYQYLNNLKKKDDIVSLQFTFRKCYEMNLQFNEFQNQFKDANQNVELKLNTHFENHTHLLSFCKKIMRYGHQLRYLIWNVKGLFQDDDYTNIIGDLVSHFTNLYKFEFNLQILNESAIHSGICVDSGMLSFSKGLKQLTQLRSLNINILNQKGNNSFSYSESKSIQKLTNIISNLPNLEILNSVNKAIIQCFPPKKLSNYYYFLNLQNKVAELKQSRDFTQQENYLTDLVLIYENYSLYEEWDIQKIVRQTKQFFNLKYLTSVVFNQTLVSRDKPIIISLLIQKVFCNMSNLLSILSFQKVITQFLTINPFMVIADLWIE